MKALERNALQNVAWLALQRVTLAACGLLSIMIVPRLMRPEAYGRFSLLASVTALCVTLSELGLMQTLSRYLPRQALESGRAGVAWFFGSAVALRATAALAAAAVGLVAARHGLPGLDAATLALVAGGIWIRAGNETLYCLFLGLNQGARWAFGNVSRRWLTLLMVPLGFVLDGLRGAIAGLLAVEALVLLLGASWARPHLQRSGLDVRWSSFRPHIGFGLVFFAASLMDSTSRNIGTMIVRWTCHDYLELGYFGLAFGFYQGTAGVYFQFVQSLTPLLSTLVHEKRTDELSLWAERMLRFATVAAMPLYFGALLAAGHLIRIVSGPDYAPAARSLWPLALTLLAVIPGRLSNALAVAIGRPRFSIQASAIRLSVLLPLGAVLAARTGSFGMCLATLSATVAYAASLLCSVRSVIRLPLSRWALALGVGILATPLAFLTPGVAGSLLLFALATAAYGVAVWALGVIRKDEIRDLMNMLAFETDGTSPALDGRPGSRG